MQANVQLKRVSRRRQKRPDAFFYLFYLPLNLLLVYWPIPLAFPYMPNIKDKNILRWQESYGPELWILFHVMLAIVLGLVVYWCARWCYRPSRFNWLPIILAFVSLLIYWT